MSHKLQLKKKTKSDNYFIDKLYDATKHIMAIPNRRFGKTFRTHSQRVKKFMNYNSPKERWSHLLRSGSLKSRQLIVAVRNFCSGAVSRPLLALDGYGTLDITRKRTVSYTVLWGPAETCHTSTGWCDFYGLRIMQRQMFQYKLPLHCVRTRNYTSSGNGCLAPESRCRVPKPPSFCWRAFTLLVTYRETLPW